MIAATVPDAIVFAVAAVLSVLGALGVILLANPVHCALSLVTTLLGVAVLFLLQRADFLAAVQIIVYAGAVVVFFLFVIMLLGVDRPEAVAPEPLKWQRPLAVLAVAAYLAFYFLATSPADVTGATSVLAPLSSRTAIINELSRQVFSTYLLPFEATALLLIVVVIGAVLLVKRGGMVREPERRGGPQEAVEAREREAVGRG